MKTTDLTFASLELARAELGSGNMVLCVSPELEIVGLVLARHLNAPTAIALMPSREIGMRVMPHWRGVQWNVLNFDRQGEQCKK